ncbi:ATP-binding protein [bacterium]|nr:ATP-binding protein [bacterium]
MQVNEKKIIANSLAPKQPAKIEEKSSIKNSTETKEQPKKISAAILATALSAFTLGGAIVHGRSRQAIKNAQNIATSLETDNKALQSAYNSVQESVNKLSEELNTLRKHNEQTEVLPKKYKDKLEEILNGDTDSQEFKTDFINYITNKIEKCELDYDITKPPKKQVINPYIKYNSIPLPENVSTMNRVDMIDLQIPKISSDGSFDLTLPTSNEMKITKVETKKLTPIPLQKTTISENYADSIKWDNDKIARDILQNFYDGHGQTLDGVKIQFTPTPNGKYKVRIEGKSTYDAENAIYIGESTKRDNKNAAGNYGEGLKMATLKLLKDIDSDSVKIGSDEWKVTYTLEKDDISTKNRRILAFSLDNVEKYDGNYLEFETSDKELLESIRKSINRFYHSSNPDFKCPDFENNVIGIKTLNENEKGGFYIAGQKFEVNNDYDGLEGATIFLKEKPPIDILDPSRDRTSLTIDQVGKIAEWLGQKPEKLSNQEAAEILKSLESFWNKTSNKDNPVVKFVKKFVENRGIYSSLGIKFPDKYIAYSNCSDEIFWDYISRGYKICHDEFKWTGMKQLKDLYAEGKNHELITPTPEEKKKILILKEAINTVAPNLRNKHFTLEELDTKIYLFNNTSQKDKDLYNDCNAEAIIEYGESKGFWIDRNYLNESDFGNAFETALHELCHKAGGDESARFSYKLTDVNSEVYQSITTNPVTKFKLQTLSDLWHSITKENI